MKNYSGLVNKQIKINKKQTSLSALGIMIGVILLTFVVVLFKFDNIRNSNAIKVENGQYNVRYEVESNYKEKIDILNKNALVDSYSLVQNLGITPIKKNDNEINIGLVNIDSNGANNTFVAGFESVGIKDFSNKGNEVILPNTAQGLGFKNGDSITLSGKEYKVVGFYNQKINNKSGYIEAISFANHISDKDTVLAYVNVKGNENNILNNISEVTRSLGYEANSKTSTNEMINTPLLQSEYGISMNNSFSMFGMGTMELSIISMAILILLVINFGLINFTLSTKVKQFGILRCIGATPKQIRNIVYKEVAILGIISVIPGIVLGNLGVMGAVNLLENSYGFETYGTKVSFYALPILMIFILAMLSIFVGAIKPALKASRISPIEGIISGKSNSKKIKLIKSKGIRKILGVEAELAYRNLRAKPAIFWTSTLLLTISFITFVVLTTYSISMIKGISSQYNISKEISLHLMTEKTENETQEQVYSNVENEIKSIKEYLKNKGVKNDIATYMYLQRWTNMFITTDAKLNPKLINNVDFNSDYLKEVKYSNGLDQIMSNGKIWVYNDAAFNLIKNKIKGNQSVEKFNENGIVLIDSNRKILDSNTDNELNSETPVFENLKVGEKIGITFAPENTEVNTFDGVTENEANKLKDHTKELQMEVMGTISPSNILTSYANLNDTLEIIISESFFNKHKEEFLKQAKDSNGNMIKEQEEGMIDHQILFDFNSEADRLANVKNIETDLSAKYKMYLTDNAAQMQEIRNIITMITVATYTFLIVIMIILITTIIISKNLNANVRKKEFGTLLALGMDKKGLRKSILFEAILQFIIIALISTPISIIASIILVMQPEFANVSILTIIMLSIIAIIGVAIITVITSILPFKNFKNLSMSEMMREEE